jgi:hypothetical protein
VPSWRGALALGLEPEADVGPGLIIGTIVMLVPGVLLIAASMIQQVHAPVEAA